MIDESEEEFIERIYDGHYINPIYISSVFPSYKIEDKKKFIFYSQSLYTDDVQSIYFANKKEADEARKKLIKIVHNNRNKCNDR